MSEEIVRGIIEARIQDNWVLTDVDWDNIRYIPKAGTPFISPIVSNDSSNKKGFKCIQQIYTLLIEVRVPKNTGTATINGYVDALKTLFDGYEVGNFYCLKGHAVRVGTSKQWFHKNVIFQCKYKQIG